MLCRDVMFPTRLLLSLCLAGDAALAAGPSANPIVSGAAAIPIEADGWIDEIEDYPDYSERFRLDGTVQVRLFVNGSGGVGGCIVLRSRHAILGASTCSLLIRRARFQPFAGGKLATFDHIIVWDIGKVPPIPPNVPGVDHSWPIVNLPDHPDKPSDP